MKIYTNIPIEKAGDSSDNTAKFFDDFYNQPIDINNNVMLSIKAYFEKRGFDPSSAETTAIIIVSQAKKDNLNPMNILDTLQGLSDVDISGLVTEILNYYRFKTSNLGVYVTPNSSDEVQRNILA
jgi:hypothetical protein